MELTIDDILEIEDLHLEAELEGVHDDDKATTKSNP